MRLNNVYGFIYNCLSMGGGGAEKFASPSKRPASPPFSTILILSKDHDNFDRVIQAKFQ